MGGGGGDQHLPTGAPTWRMGSQFQRRRGAAAGDLAGIAPVQVACSICTAAQSARALRRSAWAASFTPGRPRVLAVMVTLPSGAMRR